MVDSIAESARKASAGTWRKPRVRIYDYNQVSLFFETFEDKSPVVPLHEITCWFKEIRIFAPIQQGTEKT